MKDYTLKAVYAGLLAVIFKDAFDSLYRFLGYYGAYVVHIAAGAFVAVDRITTPFGLIIGYTAHYAVGGALGYGFYQVLVITGRNNFIQKGVFFGILTWLLLSGMLLSLGVSRFVPDDESTQLMILLDNIVFGASLGYLVPRFLGEEFRSKK